MFHSSLVGIQRVTKVTRNLFTSIGRPKAQNLTERTVDGSINNVLLSR